MEARHRISFAARPFRVVWRRSGERAVKQGLAEAPYVYHKRQFARDRHFPQARTKLPSSLFVEMREAQNRFLAGN